MWLKNKKQLDASYEEAALLDRWRLEDWLELLTDDAEYEVPSTDAPLSKTGDALFLIADDFNRIKARVKRLNDPEAHAESPRSRTRRMISNVRITKLQGADIHAAANFSVYRFCRPPPGSPKTWDRASRRVNGLFVAVRTPPFKNPAIFGISFFE